MENNNEQEAVKIFKDVLKSELADPRVARDKKQFIAAHFRQRPSFIRPAVGMLVPAMALAAFFMIKAQPVNQVPVPAAAPVPAAVAPQQTEPAVEPIKVGPEPVKKRFFHIPRIWVKKATSQVGQPMVYQKKAGDVPVTIVWVFTPQTPVSTKPVQPGVTT